MKNDIYRKLQRHLDQMPVPFPPTRSGIEIKLLQELFTREDACLMLALSALPETAGRILGRLSKKGITIEEVTSRLDQLAADGRIMCYRSKKGNRKLYHKIPLAIGIFEFQVNRIGSGFAEMFYRYQKEAFAEAQFRMKTRQMRIIPLNVSVEPYFTVSDYDSITRIIRTSPGPFAIMNCVCRQAKDVLNQPCRHTQLRETCLTLENAASFMIKRKAAREISAAEVLKFLVKAKKEGLVLQPENTQHPGFICCCCGCCCGVLSLAREYEKPAEFIHSNFTTRLIHDSCDSCLECMKRCQMNAITGNNGTVYIDQNRCIGCGVCIPVCKNRALRLVKKKPEYKPPIDKKAMYSRMIRERYGITGMMKLGIRAVLGKKI